MSKTYLALRLRFIENRSAAGAAAAAAAAAVYFKTAATFDETTQTLWNFSEN